MKIPCVSAIWSAESPGSSSVITRNSLSQMWSKRVDHWHIGSVTTSHGYQCKRSASCSVLRAVFFFFLWELW